MKSARATVVVVIAVGALATATACPRDEVAFAQELCCECLSRFALDGTETDSENANCLDDDDLDACSAASVVEVTASECIADTCLNECSDALANGLRVEGEFVAASGANERAYVAVVSPIGGTTFDEARQACSFAGAASGGDLVSIGDGAEQTIVEGLLLGNNESWIGLTDDETEGVYTWVDGTPFDFERFDAGDGVDDGQGDFEGTSDDCFDIVHLANVWVDDDCDATKGGYVCEYRTSSTRPDDD